MPNYSLTEKQSILEAKLNDVVDDIKYKTKRSLTEEELRENDSRWYYVDQTYTISSRVEAAQFLCDILRRSNDPSLIEAARILEILSKNDSNLTEEMEKEQAKLLLMNYSEIKDGNSKTIKTTYKEFEQIRKRREKVSAKTLRKLKKYKDVVDFYDSDEIFKVVKEAKAGYIANSRDPERIANFFKYGSGSLSFVLNNPELYKLR